MPELTLGFLGMMGCAMVLGTVAHELTHAIVAKAAGGDIWFEWPPAVVYAIPVETPEWVDRFIGLAPQIVGFGIGIPAFAVFGIPTDGIGLAVIPGWLMYVWGSISDVSLAAARGKESWVEKWWSSLDGMQRDGVLAGVGFGLAATLTVAGSMVGFQLSVTLRTLALLPMVVGGFYLLHSCVRSERAVGPRNGH